MKAHGNGNPETCTSNLLRIVRGEVPYDRVRGRDGVLIDQPNAKNDAIADAEWLIKTYEPRVTVDDVETIADAAITGDFSTAVNIKKREDVE